MKVKWSRVMYGMAVCLALLGTLRADVQAREPLLDPGEMLPVELATVGVESRSGSPVVLLREPVSGDVVLISIGSAEAVAILLALQGVETPRPMTHDLLAATIIALDASVSRVMVDALVNSTYLGVIELHGRETPQDPIYVDSRPSDALALAVRTGASILVAPEILIASRGIEYESLPGRAPVTALGLTVGELTTELREALELPDLAGVVVSRAVGEAATMGMAPGALIVSVNDQTPSGPLHFLDLVRRTESGQKARISYWQNGVMYHVELSTDVPDAERRPPLVPGRSAFNWSNPIIGTEVTANSHEYLERGT
jgi:bifunctional DNase/RNase